MHFKVERLPDEQIIIVTFGRDYVFGEDTQALAQAVAAKVTGEDTNIHVVYDVREMKMSFGDLVVSMSNAAQKSAGAQVSNFKTIFVGSSEMVRLGILAFEQEQYGKMKFPLYANLEEGLKYAREQIKQRK